MAKVILYEQDHDKNLKLLKKATLQQLVVYGLTGLVYQNNEVASGGKYNHLVDRLIHYVRKY